MKVYTPSQVQAHWTQFLDEVEAGQNVIIVDPKSRQCYRLERIDPRPATRRHFPAGRLEEHAES